MKERRRLFALVPLLAACDLCNGGDTRAATGTGTALGVALVLLVLTGMGLVVWEVVRRVGRYELRTVRPAGVLAAAEFFLGTLLALIAVGTVLFAMAAIAVNLKTRNDEECFTVFLPLLAAGAVVLIGVARGLFGVGIGLLAHRPWAVPVGATLLVILAFWSVYALTQSDLGGALGLLLAAPGLAAMAIEWRSGEP